MAKPYIIFLFGLLVIALGFIAYAENSGKDTYHLRLHSHSIIVCQDRRDGAMYFIDPDAPQELNRKSLTILDMSGRAHRFNTDGDNDKCVISRDGQEG